MPQGAKTKMTATAAREETTLSSLTVGLSEDQAGLVGRVFRQRTYSSGTVILKNGDYQDFVYLVTAGKVRVYGGSKSTILVSGAGSFIGLDTLSSDTYNKTVVAIDDVSVIYSPRDTLLHLMETHPQIALNVVRILGSHVRLLEERIESFSGGALQRRLVLTLLQLAENGTPRKGGGTQVSGATHEFLASIVGASREAVTIALGKLRDMGYVEQLGKGNLVIKTEPLARVAEG